MDSHQASVNADVNINANTGTNTSSHKGTCFYRHIVSNANRKTDIGIDSNSSSEETDGKSGQPRESNTIWPSCKSRLLGDFGRKDCTGRDKGHSARESVE